MEVDLGFGNRAFDRHDSEIINLPATLKNQLFCWLSAEIFGNLNYFHTTVERRGKNIRAFQIGISFILSQKRSKNQIRSSNIKHNQLLAIYLKF